MPQPEFIEVQKYLSGASYPATRQRLCEQAKRNGASEDVIEALSGMPEGQYDGRNRVSSAITRS
jgi:Protein of unknown function (DUF2795)